MVHALHNNTLIYGNKKILLFPYYSCPHLDYSLLGVSFIVLELQSNIVVMDTELLVCKCKFWVSIYHINATTQTYLETNTL